MTQPKPSSSATCMHARLLPRTRRDMHSRCLRHHNQSGKRMLTTAAQVFPPSPLSRSGGGASSASSWLKPAAPRMCMPRRLLMVHCAEGAGRLGCTSAPASPHSAREPPPSGHAAQWASRWRHAGSALSQAGAQGGSGWDGGREGHACRPARFPPAGEGAAARGQSVPGPVQRGAVLCCDTRRLENTAAAGAAAAKLVHRVVSVAGESGGATRWEGNNTRGHGAGGGSRRRAVARVIFLQH